jgi:HTH-type transcriptional repressor of NAD biosynthesis genes
MAVMMSLEIVGFVAGLASVWLYTRQNAWAWPVGIVNSLAWALLFWGSRLYLDAGLQLVFVALGVWGWWRWLRGGPGDERLPVRRASPRERAGIAAVAVTGTGLFWWAMRAHDDAMPFWDAATTTGSLVAQYLLGRKILGTWWWWIAVDVAYVGMYTAQDLYLTAALQPLFIVLCVAGLRAWRASLRRADHELVAVVVGKFLPPHHGHKLVVDTAAAVADRVVVVVCERPDDVVPACVRASMLREIHPAATVLVTPDDVPDHAPDARAHEISRAWAERVTALCQAELGAGPDVVCSSEEYGPRFAGYLGARHVAVDRERRRVPVSGTAVRADPRAAWPYLEPCVRAWYVPRVCVVGAESTGTTTLARDLAAHYGVPWVPEYGRRFCEEQGVPVEDIPWRTEHFVTIATTQQAHEDAAARLGPPLLVCDTDALATSVWHERYVGAASPEVAGIAASRRYALYLLTGDDIPFVQDGTRDGEHLRGWMTERFRELLAAREEPWLEVRGSRQERLAAAVAAVDRVTATMPGAAAVEPTRSG